LGRLLLTWPRGGMHAGTESQWEGWIRFRMADEGGVHAVLLTQCGLGYPRVHQPLKRRDACHTWTWTWRVGKGGSGRRV
jgi:hypothetical protein